MTNPSAQTMLERALSAYNEVWENSESIDVHNVIEIRSNAMEAALRAASATVAVREAVDWHYRFRNPHKNAPWGEWKRMRGSIEYNRELFAGKIIGEPNRDETKTAVEFRPLYAALATPEEASTPAVEPQS